MQNFSEVNSLQPSNVPIHLFHQPEKIVIATKENVQSHFNVVSAFINKRSHFSANKRPCIIYIHLKKPTIIITAVLAIRKSLNYTTRGRNQSAIVKSPTFQLFQFGGKHNAKMTICIQIMKGKQTL